VCYHAGPEFSEEIVCSDGIPDELADGGFAEAGGSSEGGGGGFGLDGEGVDEARRRGSSSRGICGCVELDAGPV